MGRYRKYNGHHKYHHRKYLKSNHHVIVTYSDKIKTEGFNMTTSPKVNQMWRYIELDKNPNPKDSRKSYVEKFKISKSSRLFSKPYNSWYLDDNDVKKIDKLNKK